jgi:nucleotide-binding universal stress UspA family protein
MFNKVVWATDGSAQADHALAYAKQLVQAERGTLHIVHVVEKLVGARVAGQDANLNEREIEAKIKAQARAAERKGLNVKVHIGAGHGGEIARRIADEAADAEADVIVVGTRGHSAVVAAIIGSVTQRLLHVAGCPVLAVPPIRDGDDQRELAADSVGTAR